MAIAAKSKDFDPIATIARAYICYCILTFLSGSSAPSSSSTFCEY
jgi:hypothetical protein